MKFIQSDQFSDFVNFWMEIDEHLNKIDSYLENLDDLIKNVMNAVNTINV